MSDTYGARSVPRLASKQHGVFSRAQAEAIGVDGRTIDRRLSAGTWERLYPGVYRIAGAPATWKQSLLAACFAWGDGAVASHRAAGARRVLVAMVAARSGAGPESPLETKPRRTLRRGGLPEPVVQYPIGRYRADFAYPDALLAIEADGFAWHSSRRQLERDAARANVLTLMGWTVLHVTSEQLRDRPDAVVAAVRSVLRDRRSTGSSKGS